MNRQSFIKVMPYFIFQPSWTMTKSELRSKYKARRKALSKESIETLSLQIANRTLSLPVWDHSFYHQFLTTTNRLFYPLQFDDSRHSLKHFF